METGICRFGGPFEGYDYEAAEQISPAGGERQAGANNQLVAEPQRPGHL
jgi:hypothetical protein